MFFLKTWSACSIGKATGSCPSGAKSIVRIGADDMIPTGSSAASLAALLALAPLALAHMPAAAADKPLVFVVVG